MDRRQALSWGSAAALGLGTSLRAKASPEAKPVKATLRLKWLPQSQFAGFYLAKAKGHYLEEGIDLHINPGGPNLLTEELVATGADTFGLSGGTESVLAARDKGLPVVCVGMAHQRTPFVFVSKKNGPIKSLRDFKGKKVTAWFTGSQLVLQSMLSNAGIDPDGVKIERQQLNLMPFVNGDVDVVVAAQYNELLAIQQHIPARNLRLFVPEAHGVSFPRDTVIVSEKVAEDQPELVQAFLRASIRGWQAANQQPREAVDLLLQLAPKLDREHQEKGLAEVLRLMTAGKAPEQGLFHLDMEAIGKAHALLVHAQALSHPVNLSQAFNKQYLQAIPLEQRLM